MYTGLFEEKGNQIKLGQKLYFLNRQVVEVVFECGAYGIATKDQFDYDFIQANMDDDSNCCGNEYHGCFNDNFISLWELYWNFNCEEEYSNQLRLFSN